MTTANESTTLAFALAFLALLGLLAWLAFSGGSVDPEVATQRRSGAAGSAANADLADALDERARAAGAEVPLEPPALPAMQVEALAPLLRGRVVDETGAPVAGAEIVLGPIDARRLASGDEPTSATSSSDGDFEVEVRISASTDLVVRAPGHVHLERRVPPVVRPTELGDLVLHRALRIRGRVVDEAGSPIAGAEVVEIDPLDGSNRRFGSRVHAEVLGRTSEDGTFDLRGPARLGAAGVFTVAARHEGYLEGIEQLRIDRESTEIDGVVLRLAAGAWIRGRVVGLSLEERVRVGRVEVAVAPRLAATYVSDVERDVSERRVPVAPDGSFEVGELASQEEVVLSLWIGADHRETTRRRSHPVLATARFDGPEVELPYRVPARVRALVRSASGEPVDLLRPSGADARGQADVLVGSGGELRTDGGAFEWEAYSDESDVSLELAVESADGSRWTEAPILASMGVTIDLGEVTLSPPDPAPSGDRRSVIVTLVDEAGGAVPHDWIAYRVIGSAPIEPRLARTDARGIAAVEVPRHEAAEVRYSMRRFERGRRDRATPGSTFLDLAPWAEVPAGDDARVEVRLPPLARTSARVTLDGVPLAGACVMLADLSVIDGYDLQRMDRLGNPSGPRTDGRGVVELEPVVPGTWRAWVFHPLLRMPESFDLVLGSGRNEVELTRSATRIEGRVVDREGRALAGVTVRAEIGGIHAVRTQHEADPMRRRPRLGGSVETAALSDLRAVRTDEDGGYVLDGVTPDRDLVAVAVAPWFVTDQTPVVRVERGETRRVDDIVLVPSGRLHVELPDAHDGDLWLMPRAGDGNDPVDHPGFWASIAGARTLDGVPEGLWTLRLEWQRVVDDRGLEVPDTVTSKETRVVRVRTGETVRVSPGTSR